MTVIDPNIYRMGAQFVSSPPPKIENWHNLYITEAADAITISLLDADIRPDALLSQK
jgi:hypothetical protein